MMMLPEQPRREEAPLPSLADWGYGLTTCIAAITGRAGIRRQGDDMIVTSSDTRMSFSGEFAADGSVKLNLIHPNWGVMVAGNDISAYVPVVERAKKLLTEKSGTLTEMMECLKTAYRQEFRSLIEDGYLSRYDMTLDEFKKKGKAQLLAEEYTRLSLEIKIFSLGCTFLAYGVDDQKIGHIFTVSNPGKVEVYDKPGFWAIGRGATSALSMLAALGQVRGRTKLEETVYNVLAAKFASETASDVGKETTLFIKRHGSGRFSYKGKLEEEVRKIWDSEGRPVTNRKAVELINKADFQFGRSPMLKRSGKPASR
jgi:20S proteasome alpha/beta subunit